MFTFAFVCCLLFNFTTATVFPVFIATNGTDIVDCGQTEPLPCASLKGALATAQSFSYTSNDTIRYMFESGQYSGPDNCGINMIDFSNVDFYGIDGATVLNCVNDGFPTIFNNSGKVTFRVHELSIKQGVTLLSGDVEAHFEAVQFFSSGVSALDMTGSLSIVTCKFNSHRGSAVLAERTGVVTLLDTTIQGYDYGVVVQDSNLVIFDSSLTLVGIGMMATNATVRMAFVDFTVCRTKAAVFSLSTVTLQDDVQVADGAGITVLQTRFRTLQYATLSFQAVDDTAWLYSVESDVIISDLRFTNSTAGSKPGTYGLWSQDSQVDILKMVAGDMTLTGAIVNAEGSRVQVRYGLLTANEAVPFYSFNGTLDVEHSIIASNRGQTTGGVHVVQTLLSIIDCRFFKNMYLWDSAVSPNRTAAGAVLVENSMVTISKSAFIENGPSPQALPASSASAIRCDDSGITIDDTSATSFDMTRTAYCTGCSWKAKKLSFQGDIDCQ